MATGHSEAAVARVAEALVRVTVLVLVRVTATATAWEKAMGNPLRQPVPHLRRN